MATFRARWMVCQKRNGCVCGTKHCLEKNVLLAGKTNRLQGIKSRVRDQNIWQSIWLIASEPKCVQNANENKRCGSLVCLSRYDNILELALDRHSEICRCLRQFGERNLISSPVSLKSKGSTHSRMRKQPDFSWNFELWLITFEEARSRSRGVPDLT
jgi:hypothetical protein